MYICACASLCVRVYVCRYAYCRIDGSTKGEDRDDAVETFNMPNSEKYACVCDVLCVCFGVCVCAMCVWFVLNVRAFHLMWCLGEGGDEAVDTFNMPNLEECV